MPIITEDFDLSFIITLFPLVARLGTKFTYNVITALIYIVAGTEACITPAFSSVFHWASIAGMRREATVLALSLSVITKNSYWEFINI